MVWGTVESVITKALHYSTPLSYAWLFLLFTFRSFIVAVVGGSVYGDESGNFKCDTNQPGCQNVCFNRFSPISHMRFWAFQLLFVCLPTIIFMGFAQFELAKVNMIKKQKEEEQVKQTSNSEYYNSASYWSNKKKLDKKSARYGVDKLKKKTTVAKEGVVDVAWTPRIRTIFIVHLIARFGMECLFIYLSYLLQQQQSKKTGLSAMWVPEKYECTHGEFETNSACSQNTLIPCWVSRPWEKTIFMLYMTIISVISAIICVVEFIYVLTRTTRKSLQRRAHRNVEKKQLMQGNGKTGNGSIVSESTNGPAGYPKLPKDEKELEAMEGAISEECELEAEDPPSYKTDEEREALTA
ncbi:Oidioi.mRNA.OKI2018_I69.chr2.g6022.t1.cds [Oikopleura dioica]|uniref:Oidioi.mRNA.OKI2018_I69.chr2.g6022.t1.cds n=1 Tax=Oikopleura dioica TaxID=34765 RepID=A0ABN7T5L8_OIKDI|nr:Oidioi.mRNA.OKI2018_I69.chr2.g6022.t1.cds [Oikopleura dioica]